MTRPFDRLPTVLAIAALAGLAPAAALALVGSHYVDLDSVTHFASVTVTAIAAAGASVAITILARRRNDGRALLFSTAFLIMALSLTLHGLASPGVLIGMNGLVAVSGALTVPLGAVVLAASTISSLRRPDASALLLRLQLWLVAGVILIGAFGLTVPEALPQAPTPRSTAAIILLFVSLALFGLLAYRAVRTFLLTRRLADVAAAAGIGWLAASLVGALAYTPWEMGWWFGHAFEVIGIAVVGSAVAYDLSRGSRSDALAGDLAPSRLVVEAEAFLGPRVRAVLAHLAAKDASTESHTRRVAALAVEAGERLGLGAVELRELAIAGLLHDIGKLSVPATILRKPHPLTPEEYDVVKSHPEQGERLLHELGGFSPIVHRLVLTHHERLDGSGYPRKLRGDELTSLDRLLGACDVYDALASTRVYRSAWTPAQALAFLDERVGIEFDERCVNAIRSVVLGDAKPASPWERFLPVPAEQQLAKTQVAPVQAA